MKVCEKPCFDCPFRRDSTPGFEFDYKYLWGNPDDAIRDPDPYICEEQGELCVGQVTVLANNNYHIMVDPFGEWFGIIETCAVNREEYFWMGSEMKAFHEYGGTMWGQQWYWDNFGRGNKKQNQVAVMSGTQMTFKDFKAGI